MGDLIYFDCNVQIGKFGYKHPMHKWRTEHILEEMKRTGIAGALVYHGMAKSHSPSYGNSLLPEEIAKSNRLFGCQVLLPSHMGDFPDADEAIADMRSRGIRAAKLFPKSHRFETDRRTIGHILDVLEQEQIPLLVDAGEVTFAQLEAILSHSRQLPVLLQGQGWSFERMLFPLMDAFPNMHIEFSALQSNRIIEMTTQRFGPERLLFGSGMPAKSPGAARALIDYARISDEDKRLIAGGNLIRLLGGIAPPPEIMPDQDEVTRNCSRGLPLGIPVLDSHTHLIEPGGNTGSGLPMLHGTIEGMVELYRALGIRKMSVAPWVGVNGGDAEAANEITEQTIAAYPDMVEGFVLIDPNYTSDVESQARKWHLEKRFKGIKPYYYASHTKYTDKVYAPWWKLGNQLRLYALVDPGLLSDHNYVAQIEELAVRYPEVNFFMDHAGRTFEIAELYAGVAKKYENVTLQLTYTTVTLGVIEYLVGEVGASKLLFGTDSPMRDPRPQVGWLAYADLPIEDKKAIFGGNFRRILGRALN